MTRVTSRYLYDLALDPWTPASVGWHLMHAADEMALIEAFDRELEAEHPRPVLGAETEMPEHG